MFLGNGRPFQEVGYQGGKNDNPTYRNHPGHAEGIELNYDADQTSFREILDYFFRIHNPTTVDQQGNDRGSSYRSAIFIQNEEEQKVAEEVIAIVNDSGRWEGNAVTTLEPFSTFWPAEPDHQDGGRQRVRREGGARVVGEGY